MSISHKRVIIWGAVGISLAAALSIGIAASLRQEPVRIPFGFRQGEVDLGTRYLGQPIFADYEFVNNSSMPITLRESVCCGLRSKWLRGPVVAPGGETTLRLTYAGGPGILNRKVSVTAAETAFILRIRGKLLAGIQVRPRPLVVELVAESEAEKQVSLQLRADDGAAFRILEATSSSEQLRVEPFETATEALAHTLTLRAGQGGESAECEVAIKTTHPRAGQVKAAVIVKTLPDILIQPGRFILAPDAEIGRVMVYSRGGRAFDVTGESYPRGTTLQTETNDETTHFLTLNDPENRILAGSPAEVSVRIDGRARMIPAIRLKARK